MSVRALTRPMPVTRRQQLEDAVERALAALDALDGDPDFEEQAEDEGAQCDDEGAIEMDADWSDDEASLCGVSFGVQHGHLIDLEGTGAEASA